MTKSIGRNPPDTVTMARNILSCFDRCDKDASNWYTLRHEEIVTVALEHSVSIETVCGVMAALSPNLRWERNFREGFQFIIDYKTGVLGNYSAYGANVLKATRIMDGESPLDVLGGNKVRSFYQNLLDPQSSGVVTVDRHAINIAVNGVFHLSKSGDYVASDKQYKLIASAYVLASGYVGLKPHELQAAVWSIVADKTGY